ncbi:MAG TPA: carboxymuconolactone decarboxylase family protein [Terriglobales bacterium]
MDYLIDSLPDYAKDLKLNYSSLVRQDTTLTDAQRWGTIVATAMASKNERLIAACVAEATTHVAGNVIEGAKGAAAIMGMNNIYYRFQHSVSNEKYRTMPARLRMNILRTHGVEHADFELWCEAVSAVNGCQACMDSHEKSVREKGLTEDHVLQAIRIASIVHAIADVLTTEEALQGFPQTASS